MLIEIDEEKCIGCGACVRDCLRRSIDIRNGKAVFCDRNCIQCGHCYAVCPVKAIEIDGFEEEAYTYERSEMTVDPEHFIKMLRWRRSVRQFSSRAVEKEKLKLLAEAARYAPTARNVEEISYVFVQERVEEFRRLLWNGFERRARENLEKGIQVQDAKRYIANAGRYHSDPCLYTDLLTFEAPVIIAVIQRINLGFLTVYDAGLGCANIEHMAVSLGLGMLHCALGAHGGDYPEIREFLGLKEGEKLLFTLMLGYPLETLKYYRTPPRRNDLIRWL